MEDKFDMNLPGLLQNIDTPLLRNNFHTRTETWHKCTVCLPYWLQTEIDEQFIISPIISGNSHMQTRSYNLKILPHKNVKGYVLTPCSLLRNSNNCRPSL